MTTREAWEIIGGLGKPSKMPGRSYGLPVSACRRGAMLAKDPRTPCGHCYAADGFYHANAATVGAAQGRRLASLRDERWTDAMVTLLLVQRQPWFRWHDSGDLQGTWHLGKICDVADRTPAVRHWLPTHEPAIVAEFLSARALPANLCVRVSADRLWSPAAALADLPTSTVHRGHGNARAVAGIECKAYTRDNRCGKCRACWDRRVANVSYPAHGVKEARFQLPLLGAA
jgi:hypothetical protein